MATTTTTLMELDSNNSNSLSLRFTTSARMSSGILFSSLLGLPLRILNQNLLRAIPQNLRA